MTRKPVELPALDVGDRQNLVRYIEARLIELRDDLEKVNLTKKRTQQIRGAIAELRDLIGKLNPKPREEPANAERRPIYA